MSRILFDDVELERLWRVLTLGRRSIELDFEMRAEVPIEGVVADWGRRVFDCDALFVALAAAVAAAATAAGRAPELLSPYDTFAACSTILSTMPWGPRMLPWPDGDGN